MTEPAFLLDSNICIYILGGVAPHVRARLEQRMPGEVVTSSIVYAEVMRGIDPRNRDRTEKAERLFTLCPIRDFDRDAAQSYRALPFKRASFDRLIAAHALALGAVLITNNEADFADVPGLRVENWTLPA